MVYGAVTWTLLYAQMRSGIESINGPLICCRIEAIALGSTRHKFLAVTRRREHQSARFFMAYRLRAKRRAKHLSRTRHRFHAISNSIQNGCVRDSHVHDEIEPLLSFNRMAFKHDAPNFAALASRITIDYRHRWF